jgi:hypothetical protein
MAYGQRRVSDMIAHPGESKLIEYMTTTRAGKNLGKQLAKAPHGDDFNKPTGRIYNETQLLKRLKVSHDAATVQRLAKTPATVVSIPAEKEAENTAEPERSIDGGEPGKSTEALPNDPLEK